MEIEQLPLPDGWRWAKLAEVIASVQSGFATSERATGGFIQLRTNNINRSGAIDLADVLRVPEPDNSLVFDLRAGDILFNNTNSQELVGKTAIFEGYPERLFWSNHISRIRANADLANSIWVGRWLHYLWETKFFAELATRWVGQAAVQRDKLIPLPIPLPPLREQRRIVAALNERRIEIQNCRLLFTTQFEQANRIADVFVADQIRNYIEGSATRLLGEFAELLPARSIVNEGDAVVAAATSACLTEHGFRPSGIKSARMRAEDVPTATLSSGEILIARSNTPELVGRVSIFEAQAQPVVASDLVIRIWVPDEIERQVVAAYLSNLYKSGFWIDHASGASGTMKKITRTRLSAIPIPYRGKPESIALLNRLDAGGRLILKLLNALEAASAELATLESALLRAAFSGAL